MLCKRGPRRSHYWGSSGKILAPVACPKPSLLLVFREETDDLGLVFHGIELHPLAVSGSEAHLYPGWLLCDELYFVSAVGQLDHPLLTV